METGEHGDPMIHVPRLAGKVPNQEPEHVITQHHSGVVVTVLVTLLNQIVVMMEHAQVKKKKFLNICFSAIKLRIL